VGVAAARPLRDKPPPWPCTPGCTANPVKRSCTPVSRPSNRPGRHRRCSTSYWTSTSLCTTHALASNENPHNSGTSPAPSSSSGIRSRPAGPSSRRKSGEPPAVEARRKGGLIEPASHTGGYFGATGG
jgi:hypothetical protein